MYVRTTVINLRVKRLPRLDYRDDTSLEKPTWLDPLFHLLRALNLRLPYFEFHYYWTMNSFNFTVKLLLWYTFYN